MTEKNHALSVRARLHRATKDLDLLGRGKPDIERLEAVFREVVAEPCLEDGIVFEPDGISGAPIREEAAYTGVRVVIPCHLAGARVKVQVDVGLGDATVPQPSTVELASMLDLPSPKLLVYAKETVVAEKLEALVVLGLTTSRMKDLYDLDLLRRTFSFDDTLTDAVRATFSRRGTVIPTELPIGLSDTFADDDVKNTQWRAFLRKSGAHADLGLDEVVNALREWLWPILKRANVDDPR